MLPLYLDAVFKIAKLEKPRISSCLMQGHTLAIPTLGSWGWGIAGNLRPACDAHWLSGKGELLRETVSQAEEEMGVGYVIAVKLGVWKSVLKFPQPSPCSRGPGKLGSDGRVLPWWGWWLTAQTHSFACGHYGQLTTHQLHLNRWFLRVILWLPHASHDTHSLLHIHTIDK